MLIKFQVKTLDDRNHEFEIDDSKTVHELKQQIQEEMGVDINAQRLICFGQNMVDNVPLHNFGIDGKVIHMVPNLPPRLRVSTSTPEHNTMPENAARTANNEGLTESPTATRIYNLRVMLRDIARSWNALPCINDSEDDTLFFDSTLHPDQTDSDTRPLIEQFAGILNQINQIEAAFTPHRVRFMQLLQVQPQSEGDIILNSQYYDAVGAIFHHLGHAYHLISDIRLLISRETMFLSSDVLVRVPHPTNLHLAGSPLASQGNQINELNIGVLDPITVQLQIEARVPVPVSLALLNQRGQNNETRSNDNPPTATEAQANQNQPANQEQTPENRDPPRNDTNDLRENRMGAFTAESLSGFEFQIEDVPFSRNEFQNLLEGQQNLGGQDHNVFLAHMPLNEGNPPGAELIQHILSSLNQQNLSPNSSNGEWQVLYPNVSQNSGNANNFMNTPNSGIGNENSSPGGANGESSPNNQGSNDSPSVHANQCLLRRLPRFRHYLSSLPPVDYTYDETLRCDSRHILDTLLERSHSVGDPTFSPMDVADSPQMMYNIRMLAHAVERNPRAPEALYIAITLLLRESIIMGPSRLLPIRTLPSLGNVLQNHFRQILGSAYTSENAEALVDALMERNRSFIERVPQIVTTRQDVDLFQSVRSLLRANIGSLMKLVAETDPAQFCRQMRLLLSGMFWALRDLLVYYLKRNMTALMEVFTAYVIDCVKDFDDITRDLVIKIAIFNGYIAVHHLELLSFGQRPAHVRLYKEQPDKEVPSTSRSRPESTSSARDTYSGAVPRTRPSPAKCSRKSSTKISVRQRSASATASPNLGVGKRPRPVSCVESSAVSAGPPKKHIKGPDSERIATSSDSDLEETVRRGASSTSSEPLVDYWDFIKQMEVENANRNEATNDVPFSDAYLSGMPRTSREQIRMNRPPTRISLFVQDINQRVDGNASADCLEQSDAIGVIKCIVKDICKTSEDYKSRDYKALKKFLEEDENDKRKDKDSSGP